MEGGMRKYGLHSSREDAVGSRQVTLREVEDYLAEAEHRWKRAQRAWTAFCAETDINEKAKKCTATEALEELSVQGLQQYLDAKYQVLAHRGADGALIPVGNVLHLKWSGVDITMNGKLISTTSQKYMYKFYIETTVTLQRNIN